MPEAIFPMTKENYDKFSNVANKLKSAFKAIIGIVKRVWKAIKIFVVRARAHKGDRKKMDQFRAIQLKTKSKRIRKKQEIKIMKMVFNI